MSAPVNQPLPTLLDYSTVFYFAKALADKETKENDIFDD